MEVLIVCSSAGSYCVLHRGDGSSDGTVVPLVNHTLDKCRTVPSIRKGKNLKYKEVVLPENLNNKKTGYHAECYRKFIALGRNVPLKNDNVESKSVHTRSKSTLTSDSSSTGIMPEIYIFCAKKDKKHNGCKQKLISVETEDFEEKIKKYATALGDQALLSKLGSLDFAAKEICYHGICRMKYQAAAKQVSKTRQNREVAKSSTNLWHRGKEVHYENFKSIYSLVEDQVITGGDVLGLKGAYTTKFQSLKTQALKIWLRPTLHRS